MISGGAYADTETHTLDEVIWYAPSDGSSLWPNTLTATMCLPTALEDSVENDDAGSWGTSSASAVWASSPENNTGTPGEENTTCN